MIRISDEMLSSEMLSAPSKSFTKFFQISWSPHPKGGETEENLNAVTINDREGDRYGPDKALSDGTV